MKRFAKLQFFFNNHQKRSFGWFGEGLFLTLHNKRGGLSLSNRMNRKIILLFAVLGFLTSGVEAQNAETAETAVMTARFNASYDSLMHSFYLKNHSVRTGNHDATVSIADFDQIPDSVIEGRLKRLHTVINMSYNEAVRAYIRTYLKIMSNRLDVMTSLCEMYHPMFEETLAAYGVPEELKYLAIVESAMNPQATSRVGAAGLWQFMYHTGKVYDLEVNSLVDQRRDPYASTVAAARYLRDLHRIFGDWILAIAAYNCGPGNVNKAIARSGGKTDYWAIYPNLPRETRGYIPAFIAATYVMNYYPEHGIKPHKIELPTRSDTVMLRKDVMYCFVEQFAGVSTEELRTLNPQYKTDFVPASTGSYHLALPADKIHTFIDNEDSIYANTHDSLQKKPVATIEKEVKPSGGKGGGSTVYHKVKQGETLSRIAAKYGTSVAQLKKRNGLKGDKIRAGQRIRVR